MPIPPPAIPPVAGALYAGAAHLAAHAAPLLPDVLTLSYASISVWLLRFIWKNKVPEWAKEDVSFRNLLSKKKAPNNDNDNNDKDETELSASERDELEMANLSSILVKLRALVQSVELDDDHPTLLQQHAALLAYIQLCAQIKRQEIEQFADKGEGDHEKSDEHEDDEQDEKKVEEAPSSREEQQQQEETATKKWKSRDHLFEISSGLSSSDHTLPREYKEFCANPKASPLWPKLQKQLNFATWAYYDDAESLSERLAHEDFCLLQHSLRPSRPGHVAYYVAMSSASQKQLVVGIRGTSSLEDIITDVCGRSVPLDDRPYYYDHDKGSTRNQANNDHDPSRIEVTVATPTEEEHEITTHTQGVEIIPGNQEQIMVERHRVHSTTSATNDEPTDNSYQPLLYCHEGIMVSAKRLVDSIQDQVEYWCVKRNYQLVLVGHSLGAGVASLTGVLLRLRIPELTLQKDGETPRMHVFCFAPPPVLDKDASLASTSYTTSIVGNADMIPRCSLVNLLILLEILKGIWKELQQQDLAPTGAKTTAAFFKRLAKGTEGVEPLMSASAVRTLMSESADKVHNKGSDGSNEVDDHSAKGQVPVGEQMQDTTTETRIQSEDIVNHNLFIPGVVFLAYEPYSVLTTSDNARETPARDNTTTEANESSLAAQPCMSWILTDGHAPALQHLDGLDSRMFVDHTTTAYYSLLDLEYIF